MSDKTIFHIDVNSAFLSWESVYRLSHGETTDYRLIPSVVGGSEESRHGIVLAKSLPTKPYGIKTAETLHEARKKCPILKVLPAHYDVYVKSSKAMVDLVKEYTDVIQVYSIDELFLDATNAYTMHKNVLDLADEIRERIYKELGFTVCVGVSNNKLLAKMATDLRKPNFTTTLYPHEVEQKMWPLPVGDLFMVGRQTEKQLKSIGIDTIGDLANFSDEWLHKKLKSHGIMIKRLANGIETSEISSSAVHVEKGMGNSTTTPRNIETLEEANLVLLSLVESVGMRLRFANYHCGVIAVSLRDTNFINRSHQKKLISPTNNTTELYEYAKIVLNELWNKEPFRHIGFRTSELKDSSIYQTSIFDKQNREKQEKVDIMVDKIRERFGSSAVYRSCFANTTYKPVQGGVGNDDFQMMSSRL